MCCYNNHIQLTSLGYGSDLRRPWSAAVAPLLFVWFEEASAASKALLLRPLCTAVLRTKIQAAVAPLVAAVAAAAADLLPQHRLRAEDCRIVITTLGLKTCTLQITD